VGSAITGRRLLAAREPDEVDLPDAREPFEADPEARVDWFRRLGEGSRVLTVLPRYQWGAT